MNRAFFIIGLVAYSSITLGPAACVSGLLEHPCEPEHADPCHHESECTADPCNAVFVRPDAIARGEALRATWSACCCETADELEPLLPRLLAIQRPPPLERAEQFLSTIVLLI